MRRSSSCPATRSSSTSAATRAASLERLAAIAERLRAPDGCPWDREQTHASLRPHLLEEAYEALDAIDSADPAKLRDELGDLLFQIVIHAQLASEAGTFDLGAVADRVSEKLVRRHPHVFEGKPIAGDDLLRQWERIKREESEDLPEGGMRSLMSGVPRSSPALFGAERLQERAARVGIAPDRIDLPLDVDDAVILGDLLFDLVAEAREQGIDAEAALRSANERFAARVARVEAASAAKGKSLDALSAAEVRDLWERSA